MLLGYEKTKSSSTPLETNSFVQPYMNEKYTPYEAVNNQFAKSFLHAYKCVY